MWRFPKVASYLPMAVQALIAYAAAEQLRIQEEGDEEGEDEGPGWPNWSVHGSYEGE